jgi:hypothetical protein
MASDVERGERKRDVSWWSRGAGEEMAKRRKEWRSRGNEKIGTDVGENTS